MPSAAKPRAEAPRGDEREGPGSPAKPKRTRAPHTARGRPEPLPDQSLPPTNYETDFYAWCFEQAENLRQRRFRDADLPNVIEELESMGRSVKNALASSYRVLIAHLLKWEYQPEKRTRSWLLTITRERDNIEREEMDNKTLRSMGRSLAEAEYRRARKEAALETRLLMKTFPADCPYPVDFLRNHDAFPGTPFNEDADRLADDED